MNYIITIYFDPEGKTNTFGAYFMYYFCIIDKKRMAPCGKSKNFPENFFYFGGGWKKDPLPLGELKTFWGRYFGGPENFRHFGQQTVATQKPQS